MADSAIAELHHYLYCRLWFDDLRAVFLTYIVAFAILSACAALSNTLEAAAEDSVAAVATCSLVKPELALLLVVIN